MGQKTKGWPKSNLCKLGASYGQDGEARACVCCLEEEGKLHSQELLKAYSKNELVLKKEKALPYIYTI